MKTKKEPSKIIPISALKYIPCPVCKGKGGDDDYFHPRGCKLCYGVGRFWMVSNEWICNQ